MKKLSAVEHTDVRDPSSGNSIEVTTSARITFRNFNPTWKKARNNVLNYQIALQFAKARHERTFKPKSGSGNMTGEIRIGGDGAKYTAIDFGSVIRIIAVSGSPRLSVPAPVIGVTAARSDFSDKMKGFMEDHAVDFIKDMYNLDHNAFELLMREMAKLDSSGGSPTKMVKKLMKEKGRDELLSLFQLLANKGREKELTREIDYPTPSFAVPNGRDNA